MLAILPSVFLCTLCCEQQEADAPCPCLRTSEPSRCNLLKWQSRLLVSTHNHAPACPAVCCGQ